MPRADCTVTRLSLQTGTPPSGRIESFLRKSQKDLTQSQNIQQRRLGAFTITKRITNTTYQSQGDKEPAINKTVHRNHPVEDYPKEGSLPAMIEKHVPPDHQNDNLYERFMEQRSRDLINPSTTDERDSSPFAREPLRSSLSKAQRKRLDTHSKDSQNCPTPPTTADFLPSVLLPKLQTDNVEDTCYGLSVARTQRYKHLINK